MQASLDPLPPRQTFALKPPSPGADRFFRVLSLLAALSLFVLIGLVLWQLIRGSFPALHRFGWRFLVSSEWNPVAEKFGAFPFIYGTLASSLLALAIAVPLSIGTALFLTELAPQWVRRPLISLIEMLAAVPSVILGLWGIFILVPWLRDEVMVPLSHLLGDVPLFKGPIYGVSLFAGGIIVAIMIIPIITSVAREILSAVPQPQREAAYALGATRWEVTSGVVLKYARNGLFGAIILGLGRALGETMAITMVIGNRPEISASLFAPGYTLASVLANEFAEATSDLYLQSLIEIGLVLFGVTVVVNLCARLLLRALTQSDHKVLRNS